jgi:hypothetical protein
MVVDLKLSDKLYLCSFMLSQFYDLYHLFSNDSSRAL